MHFISEYGLFLAKSITVVIAIIAVLVVVISLKKGDKNQGQLTIKKLNDKFQDMADLLLSETLHKGEYKKHIKAEKKALKIAEKSEKHRPRIFVLNFDGDIQASSVDALREEITAILTIATPKDEVVVNLESPGGVVHGYGLAASQLARIRAQKIHLTICVDKVAASGGYLMACVADKIMAAPFAIIGSIGVIAQLPNFNRLLKKHEIDFEQFTAGEFKRTVTMFGENTDHARAKFKDELEDIHNLFKEFIHVNRPIVDVNAVATGEHWLATRALGLGLVDKLMTSDDYLLASSKSADIYEVKFEQKKSIADRILQVAQTTFAQWHYVANP